MQLLLILDLAQVRADHFEHRTPPQRTLYSTNKAKPSTSKSALLPPEFLQGLFVRLLYTLPPVFISPLVNKLSTAVSANDPFTDSP
jgi:hypothetical protein